MMGVGRTILRFLFLGAISALLIALGVRLWDEILGLRRREGHVTKKDILSADEVEGAEGSDRIELDRPVLPGISIRS